ncbi:hypothetical protein BY996DRAFT_4579133 [Phakopsora pachyrhizi]|nr:hypothetical protein BY996DRAFT_4579133 [Phakopsora pachyrhizi]
MTQKNNSNNNNNQRLEQCQTRTTASTRKSTLTRERSVDQIESVTSILLPPEIILPITVQHLLVPTEIPVSELGSPSAGPSSDQLPNQPQPQSQVYKTTPLFTYFNGIRSSLSTSDPKGKNRAKNQHQNLSRIKSQWDDHLAEDIDQRDVLMTYESPVSGQLVQWLIQESQVLTQEQGWRLRPILRIKEPCTHSVQWHGQCAICGSDLTISDYTGISETSRASISMSHGPSTLKVSISEAHRLESETRRRLLDDQKLSLIVDLDQTIVHATVDPTVGDPGLPDFLRRLATRYEMHVYTMGTRAYADAVCRIIDPGGEIFRNRILSRDESGSITQKSITRLFPVDTSMVVIIDDRGDVWEYSPNLVSVVPYNFFIGTGDINGGLLPPTNQLQPLADTSLQTSSDPKPADRNSSKLQIPIPTSTSSAEAILTTQACETSSLPISSPTSTTTIITTDPADHSSSSSPSPSFSSSFTEDLALATQSKLLLDRPLKQRQIELDKAQRIADQRRSRKPWKLAEQFGATCYKTLSSRVTHLVAAKLGTSKVNTALSRPHVKVVKPKWLFDAVVSWRRPQSEEYSWRNESIIHLAKDNQSTTKDNQEQVVEPIGELGEEEDEEKGWEATMDQFDWKDAAEEVMAALDETDDETGSVREQEEEEEEELGSPLLKRQKLARSRSSKLKLSITNKIEEHFTSKREEKKDDDDDVNETGGESLTAEEDEFLTALAAEMEGNMNDNQ